MPDIDFAFEPPSRTSVPIAGESRHFPVRRIYCVGRNYADHIREMGGDERQPPFFFQKPTDAIVLDGAKVPYPAHTQDFQHEIELVLAIGVGGINILTNEATSHVFGVAAGIDLTRRDVQIQARNSGRPWEVGKAFDQSAPLGQVHIVGAHGIPCAGEISLSVNGAFRQRGDLSEMIWGPTEIVSQLSRQYRLEPGDLIYTGTPAGVGSLSPGDVVEGRIAGLTPVRVSIVAPVDV
jgi:fumarylpyruvate hydrolase